MASSTYSGGDAGEQESDESSGEESGSHASEPMHNPVLRLALSLLCLAFLFTVFVLGIVILIVRSITGKKVKPIEENVTDVADIELETTVRHNDTDLDINTTAQWPFELFPLNWSYFGLSPMNASAPHLIVI
ncbi:uncharacterized protein LOC135398053 [Ornithodoros turicata]|uniref:uncharacterized protein LOC135375740 n=1 Tax=Ornithodoros turicata TaxID=34597 RepID=UPI003138CF79